MNAPLEELNGHGETTVKGLRCCLSLFSIPFAMATTVSSHPKQHTIGYLDTYAVGRLCFAPNKTSFCKNSDMDIDLAL